MKVNFDGNIRDAKGGVGYVIQDLDGMLLVAGGSCLFKPPISEAELRTAWVGIIYAS